MYYMPLGSTLNLLLKNTWNSDKFLFGSELFIIWQPLVNLFHIVEECGTWPIQNLFNEYISDVYDTYIVYSYKDYSKNLTKQAIQLNIFIVLHRELC